MMPRTTIMAKRGVISRSAFTDLILMKLLRIKQIEDIRAKL